MADQVKNFAYSTTTAAVTAGATSFSVQSGHGARFTASASGAYNLVVWNPNYLTADIAYQNGAAEIVRVTTRATDTFSVITRAQEGTSAIAWGIGWRVEQNATAKNFTDLVTTLAYVDIPIIVQVGGNFGSASTNYSGLGAAVALSAAENSVQYSPFGITGSVRSFYVQAKTNTINATTTISLESGAADTTNLTTSGLTATLANGITNAVATGEALDITPTGIGGLKFVVGGSSGTMTLISVTLVVRCNLA